MTFELIVVGTGKWGLNHVATAHSLGVLRAVVDASAPALEKARTQIPSAHVTFHPSLEDALDRHPNAAVVIATPPTTHFTLARHALLAGRNVLVEKPFCTDLHHAETLVQLARQNGLILMVDHLLQYSIHHRRLIHLVRAGYVGTVTRIRMNRLNFGTIRLEENVLWSFSPHDISIVLSLCADRLPTSVSCVGQRLVSKEIEDHVDLALQFADGVHAKIEASWMHPLKERRTVVYGTKGCIILNEASPDPNAKKLQGFQWSAKRRADGSSVAIDKSEHDVVEQADEVMRALGISPEEIAGKQPLQDVLEHFGECIEMRTSPRTDGDEALRVVKVLTSASESLARDGAKIDMSTCTPREAVTHPNADFFVHSSAVVDTGAVLGSGSKVWHFSHIMGGAQLGERCNIGQNVYIGGKAKLGKNVKVQNNVSIYDRVEIEDDAFLGPSCVFTNVKTPRSHISRKQEYAKTVIKKGSTVGANATIICGVTLGKYCLIGAGAVVTKDVPAHAMVYGNPASIQGWVSTTGARLVEVGSESGVPILKCEESGETYTFSSLPESSGKSQPKLIPYKSTTIVDGCE